MRSIILAIDVRNSNIGCTGYEYDALGPVNVVNGVGHSVPITAFIASTGNIRIHEVLLTIDKCIDETMRLLRLRFSDSSFQVVAVGFTTFVTNLVAVDIYGDPLGEVATCSEMCDRDDVVLECQRLIAQMGPEKLNAFQQRTGAPLHASHSLPQLRAFYGNEKNNYTAKQIEKWQTISSICLFRWSGRPYIQMPISCSEVRRTGMLNCQTCCWDDEAVNLLETCKGAVQYQYEVEDDDDDEEYVEDIDLLPPTVIFDAALPFLREGIPRYNDDGSVNSYWERWPELQSFPVLLFFGVGDRDSIIDSCGAMKSVPPPSNVQAVVLNSGVHDVAVLMAASLQQATLHKFASAR